MSPQFLAMVFQDLLTNKDDYLRASRALLREIIKQTKHEINFQAFCLGLMQERKEPQYLDMEFKVGAHARCLSCRLYALSYIQRPRVQRPVPGGSGTPSCEDQGGAGQGTPLGWVWRWGQMGAGGPGSQGVGTARTRSALGGI